MRRSEYQYVLFIVVGCLLLYHFLFAADPAGDRPPPPPVVEFEQPPRAAPSAPALLPPPPAPDQARLARLEARVESLEATLAALTKPPAPAEEPASEVAVPPVVAAAREAARRKLRENEIAQQRQEILRLDLDLAENDVSEAARLLAEHAQAVRDLYEGKDHAKGAEREQLHARYREMCRRLEDDLRGLLGADVARRLAGGAAAVEASDR